MLFLKEKEKFFSKRKKGSCSFVIKYKEKKGF